VLTRIPRIPRAAVWNIVDQALSALSNVLLSVIVARSVDQAGFGAFSIAFLVFGIALAVSTSIVGQPLAIRYSSQSVDALRSATGRAAGLALLISLVAAVGCLVVGQLISGQTGRALVALSVILPGLLIQDTCRMAFFALGQARSAALIDGVWTVAQLGILGLLILAGQTSVQQLILAWGVAAAISAALGLRMLRTIPRPERALAWLREHADLNRYLFAEYFLGLGASQIAILLVGFIASATAVGSLRAAQVLLGPLAIFGSAAFQFAVPEVARRTNMSAQRRWVFGLSISGALGSLTAVYVVVLLVLPRAFGVELFGDSWDGAEAVLLAMGLSSLMSSLANGPAGVLYGMGQAQRTFRINLAKAPVLLCLVLSGTAIWGASGAAWGLAATELISLPLWVLALRQALGAQTKGEPQGTLPAEAGTE
jgi:O-antigen/teichoic acid export membrane protein